MTTLNYFLKVSKTINSFNNKNWPLDFVEYNEFIVYNLFFFFNIGHMYGS